MIICGYLILAMVDGIKSVFFVFFLKDKSLEKFIGFY